MGTSVLQVEARDPDSTADLRYTLKQTTLEARDRSGQLITNLAPVTVSVSLILSLLLMGSSHLFVENMEQAFKGSACLFVEDVWCGRADRSRYDPL